MKLSDREWKPCKLSELGRVESGKDIYVMERIEGDIPYVTSGSQNNGIGYFVANRNKTLDKGYIAFNRNGAVGLAFYHPYWSVMGNDCRKLHISKADENIYVGFFISTVISMQSKSFSYSRKLGTARANKLQVMLPVDDNDELDYQFMEDYMKELMVAKRKQYQEYVEQRLAELGIDDVKNTEVWKYEVSFGNREWKDISITSIFDKIKTGNINNASLYKKTTGYGIEYIGATNKNNGCLYFIESSDRTNNLLQDGNCIGFIKDGDGSAGYSIYKRESFVSTVNVIYGYANWLNEYTGLFFVSAQDLIKNKYSHGYKRNQQHLRGDRVMLPVDDNGEPDFEFMEECGRKMIAKKYIQYLNFLKALETI